MENKTSKFYDFYYFNYFKKIVGSFKMYTYILLNFLVGFFDGLGLAMFIPLLTLATGMADQKNESLGKLDFLVKILKNNNIELNLINTLIMMVILFIVKGIFTYIKILYFTKIRIKALKKIRLDLIQNLGTVSYEGFTKIDAGRIQSNMIGETQKLLSALVQYFTSIQNVVMLSTYVILAFASNWRFAIMVAIGGMFTNLIYKSFNKITKENSRKISWIGYDFNGNLIQTLHHFKYLKATNYYKVMDEKMKSNINRSEEISYKLGKLSALAESIREPMIIIVIAVVILIQVQVFDNNFASIMVSLLLFYRSLGYLVSMQNTWNSFLGSSAGLESINTLNDDFNNSKEMIYPDKIEKISDITASGITLTYGEKDILKNISLSIQKNTSIAFVGESGAGKTSLANIICGLIEPHKGEIITDNKNVYKTDLSSYRNKIGYITQEPVIFNDTIFNNISFWQEKNEDNLKKFKEVMQMVSLDNFINGLPEKEDAPLGDNGVLISGGQKQRISIARELYKNVELLIMDEATSALDSQTEKYIKDNIDMLHGKFTMIIIAHRLSTIKNVDKIYLMESGEILESGDYKELIQKSPLFSKMISLQVV